MDGKTERKYKMIDGLTDAALLLLAFLLAFYVRFHLMDGDMNPEQRLAMGNQTIFTVFYALVMVMLYYFAGRYEYFPYMPLPKEITLIFLLNAVGILFYTASLYFLALPDYSRIAIILFYVLTTLLIVLKRLALVRVVRYYRQKNFHRKHVVVIGSGYLAQSYVEETKADPEQGIQVEGYVSGQQCPSLEHYLGDYAQLHGLLERIDPNEIVIALDPSETDRMPEILTACENSGIRTSIIPYYNDYLPTYPKIEVFGKCKLINIRTIPLDNPLAALLKRSFDLVVSALAILLLSPLMLFTAAGIKLTSPGPVLFRQERVGKERKPFTMYKFRSMPVDVDPTGWSTQVDARRTKFGSFIRKFSIDELPQLFNVLKGDMSLVGPRPELPNYVHKFSEQIPLYLVRQQVRPGMTGLAQINGLRGDTSIEARVEYDIRYIENWNWLLDFKILVKTALGGFANQEAAKPQSAEKV